MPFSSNVLQDDLLIRTFDPDFDSLAVLTELLHLCYQALADMGLQFVAASQPQDVTAKRIKDATCLVACVNEQIMGTICFYSPAHTKGAPWYDQSHVAKFGQFAVHPRYQKRGIGEVLLQAVEELARRDTAGELALDTAEGAEHLIRYYSKKGYRFVEFTQWKQTNYRSVLLSKQLK